MENVDLIDSIHGYLSWMVAVIENKDIKAAIERFLEDINLTRESFLSKSSILIYLDETKEMAESIYCKRFCDLCSKIIKNGNLSDDMNKIILGYNQEIAAAKQVTPDFLPDHILFSQEKHNSHFSNQSHFFEVHQKPIKEAVIELKNKKYHPRDFPLRIYCGNFRGKLRWFAANNRTWATFSGANILPIRVIPILPSHELNKRLTQLSGDPNYIQSEDSDTETMSLKEANSPKLQCKR